MACKPCEEKRRQKEMVIEKPITALSVFCVCGLQRLLPGGLKRGDKVELVPCPRCSFPFIGTFVGDHVELDEFPEVR